MKPEDDRIAGVSFSEAAIFFWSLFELLFTRIIPLFAYLTTHALLHGFQGVVSVIVSASDSVLERRDSFSEAMHRHEQSNRRQRECWIEDDFVTYDKRFQQVLRVRAPVNNSTVLRPQTGEASEDQEPGISTQPMGPKVPRETPVNEAVEFTAGLNSSSRKTKAETTPMILHASKQNEAVSTAEQTEHADSINEKVSDDRGSVLRAHEGKVVHGLLESNSETLESSNAMDTENDVQNGDRKKIDGTGQEDGAERQKRVSKGRRILAPTFSQIKRSLLSRSRRGTSTSPNRPISPRITFLS